jgi:hypothetical protein
LAAWFRAHPLLDASKPRPRTVAGVRGTQMDIRAAHPYRSPVCGGRCVLGAMTSTEVPATDPLTFLPGVRYRGVFLETKAPAFAVALIAPDRGFDRYARSLERALATLRFTDTSR